MSRAAARISSNVFAFFGQCNALSQLPPNTAQTESQFWFAWPRIHETAVVDTVLESDSGGFNTTDGLGEGTADGTTTIAYVGDVLGSSTWTSGVTGCTGVSVNF